MVADQSHAWNFGSKPELIPGTFFSHQTSHKRTHLAVRGQGTRKNII